MTQVTKTENLTISQFVNQPTINTFLKSQLEEKKGEFVSNLISLSNNNEKLRLCEPKDVMMCAMNATALNLPLNNNLGYAYVIPYKDKNGFVPQFQIGYKGFIQLAIRTGQYKTINACEVREGEIKRNKFTGEITFLKENPEGEIIGYLAYLELLSGFRQSLYMTVEEAKNHGKKYSKSYNFVWNSNFDSMSIKTVLKGLLSKYGVLSTELQQAIAKDQTDADGNYNDNPNSGSSSRNIEDAQIIPQEEPTTPPAQPQQVQI